MVLKVRIEENIVIWLLYRFTLPAAKLLSSINVSPNLITSSGLLLTGLVGYLTVIDSAYYLIWVLWYLVVLLDLVDGQVARILGKVRKHSFGYDHTSDLLKMSIFLVSLSLKYSSIILSSVVSICISAILIADKLNTDISVSRLGNNYVDRAEKKHFLAKFQTNIYTIFFTYNTHTLLFFPLLVANINLATGGLTYLATISVMNGIRFVHVLKQIPRID